MHWIAKPRFAAWLLLGLSVLSCSSLPPEAEAPASYAVSPDAPSLLATLSQKILDLAPFDGTSAFLAIDHNAEALAWRLALIDSAERSIDIQTFIWDDDAAGFLIADRVLRAADRGVRVRILIDDYHLANTDAFLVGWDRHPQIEFRLFNPLSARAGGIQRSVDMVTHMKRLNTRMHNKSFSVDGRFAIVGGRNIGDEYMGLKASYNFLDLDVLCTGPVVDGVEAAFDLYWNSDPVYPVSSLDRKKFEGKDLLATDRVMLTEELERLRDLTPGFAAGERDWGPRFEALEDQMSFGTGRVVYDEPSLGPELPEVNIVARVDELAMAAEREVLAAAPYFVPDQLMIDAVVEMTGKGVRVVAFTNSLGSNNQVAAHTGYAPWRNRLLEAGCELYELRADATDLSEVVDTPPAAAQGVGLHAKFMVVDRRRVYVGSMNLDPRSFYLNTEMGLLIDDPVLAGQLGALYDRDISGGNSWQVRLTDDGELRWVSDAGTLDRQPAKGTWQRMQSSLVGLLPIKKQL